MKDRSKGIKVDVEITDYIIINWFWSLTSVRLPIGYIIINWFWSLISVRLP